MIKIKKGRRVGRRFAAAMLLTAVAVIRMWGDAPTEISNGGSSSFSAGFLLNEYVDDFGIGLQIGMPYAWERLSVRVTGTLQLSRAADWKPWGTVQMGLIGAHPVMFKFARFYGEGGVILAFPGEMSSEKIAVGGYGHFGFEFFPEVGGPVSYFLEVGGTECGLKADLTGGALMLKGFRIQAGFRGYPFKGKKG